MNCSQCLKINDLCICSSVKPLSTQAHVLILQHPQEPDHLLGTARITQQALPNSTLKVGLSWPNLRVALGKEVQPSRWAVLYLGSGIKGKPISESVLQFVSKQGLAVPAPTNLEGIVLLDGTWSQAKALWWRNAWLLKLKRAVLNPARASLYKELRKEPRRECLSTLESAAEALTALGEPEIVGVELRKLFIELLDKHRTILKKNSSTRKQ